MKLRKMGRRTRRPAPPVDPAVAPQQVPYGRAWLAFHFAALGFRHGAEIGVWRGEYSELLCLANPGLSLLCIDPWAWYPKYLAQKGKRADDALEAAYAAAVERLTPYGCQIRRLSSVEAAAEVPDRSLDFVYIDANHAESYVRSDLAAWTPKIRPGGILAGHDYYHPRHRYTGVKAAVDAFVTERAIPEWQVLTGDEKPSFLWVVR